MIEEDTYVVTEAGHTALAEAYWRAKIAEEVRKQLMPQCVCEKCGNLKEGAIVERCLQAILGRTK